MVEISPNTSIIVMNIMKLNSLIRRQILPYYRKIAIYSNELFIRNTSATLLKWSWNKNELDSNIKNGNNLYYRADLINRNKEEHYTVIKIIIHWADIKPVNSECSHHPGIKVCEVKSNSIKGNWQIHDCIGIF